MSQVDALRTIEGDLSGLKTLDIGCRDGLRQRIAKARRDLATSQHHL